MDEIKGRDNSFLQEEQAIEILRRFGFTDYEARIYITLVKKSPMNGNAISVESGVPNSKVYESLRRLEEKGNIFSVTEGSKKKYIPLPFHNYLEAAKVDFLKDKAQLEDYFEAIADKVDADWSELYHIRGYEASIESLNQEILDAKKEIFISCWREEFNLLYDSLMEAHKKGVKVISIVFDEKPVETQWLSFHHRKAFGIDRRHLGELACVLDEKKVYVMESLTEHPHTIVGSHQALVKIALNYIRHDIYINRVFNDFEEEIRKKYGNNLEGLIYDF